MRAQRVKELILVAQGRKKADTVITHVSLVNVYSGEILPDYSAALSGGRIVYVGPERPELAGPKTEVIDGQGGALLPGFIDAHTHLDNIFTCAAYAPFALATGNTTAVTLQTFCFTGLPFIRLTDKGLVDVRGGTLLSLFVKPVIF